MECRFTLKPKCNEGSGAGMPASRAKNPRVVKPISWSAISTIQEEARRVSEERRRRLGTVASYTSR